MLRVIGNADPTGVYQALALAAFPGKSYAIFTSHGDG